MSAPCLIINGIELPQQSRLSYQQTYELLEGGHTSQRRADGSLVTMSRWQRWRTSINGGGWIPPALLGLPIGVPFEVHAVAPIALMPGEVLPTGWSARTDWPESMYVDRRGVEVRIVYPILTIVTVVGARLITGGANPTWELTGEEP